MAPLYCWNKQHVAGCYTCTFIGLPSSLQYALQLVIVGLVFSVAMLWYSIEAAVFPPRVCGAPAVQIDMYVASLEHTLFLIRVWIHTVMLSCV